MAAWKHWYRKGGEKLPKQLGEERPGQPMLVQHTSIYTKQLFHELFWSNLQLKEVHFFFFTEKKMAKFKGNDLGGNQLEAARMTSS